MEIFDKQLQPVGMPNNFRGYIYDEYIDQIGSFTIYCPMNAENLELFQQDYVVSFNSDVSGLIEYIQKTYDKATGLPELQISGRLTECIASFRIISKPYNAYNKRIRTIMQELMQAHITEPVDVNRQISSVILSDIGTDTSPMITIQRTGEQLGEVFYYFANTYSVWFRLPLDLELSKFQFRTYQGEDKTSSVILTSQNDDIIKSNYLINKTNYRNYAYVAGEGEGVDRKFAEIPTDWTGINRRELYVDAKDISTANSEETITDEQYLEMLRGRGREKLADLQIIEQIDLQMAAQDTMYIFGADYTLGDTVCIIDEDMGIQLNAKVRGVKHTYSDSVYTRELVLGFGAPSLIKRIKMEVQ